jgi:hypothetical protein
MPSRAASTRARRSALACATGDASFNGFRTIATFASQEPALTTRRCCRVVTDTGALAPFGLEKTVDAHEVFDGQPPDRLLQLELGEDGGVQRIREILAGVRHLLL